MNQTPTVAEKVLNLYVAPAAAMVVLRYKGRFRFKLSLKHLPVGKT